MAGDISAKYKGTNAEAPPTAVPSIILEIVNITALPERVEKIAPTAKITANNNTIFLCPYLSENDPITAAPTMALQAVLRLPQRLEQ